jgi:predicted ATPase
VINKLALSNFKAFVSAEVPMRPYTLLSGLNSSGKSSVLQALGLLRQGRDSLSDVPSNAGLPLNGEIVELGIGQDVLNENFTAAAGEEAEIGFRLEEEGGRSFECRVRYGRENDYLSLSYLTPEMITSESWGNENFSLFGPGFQYLRADRIIPAVTYPRSEEMSVRRRFLGTRGEYTVDFLRGHLDEPVSPGPLRYKDISPRLLDQTQAWMGEICPGVRIEAAVIEHTDLVRLGFQFASPDHPVSRPRRPTNVGFGLTYVLPVVIACLTAKPGSMILIENPEAHIHPQGQSIMANLTCAAAAMGAQLVVETHSDHILNGVRLAVKREVLSGKDVALHYFRREDNGIGIVSPEIGNDGMLSEWPPGFFDEWDRSLDQLLDLCLSASSERCIR